jgi:hypothetical protein
VVFKLFPLASLDLGRLLAARMEARASAQ